jgi:hypothetical protein
MTAKRDIYENFLRGAVVIAAVRGSFISAAPLTRPSFRNPLQKQFPCN